MNFRNSAAALAAASMVLGSAGLQAQSADSSTFEQSGPWALEFGDDFCQLAGTFSNGEDEIALALERVSADNAARLVLVGNSIRSYRTAQEIGYSYLPSGSERVARYIRSETPEGRAYYNLGMIAIGPDPFAIFSAAPGEQAAPPPPAADGTPAVFAQPPYDRAAEQEYANGITGISFGEGLQSDFRINTGSMRAPVAALQSCMDDLLLSWGLDWEKHRAMTQRAAPVGPAYEWIPGGIVGFQDWEAFAGARNSFRVMIDAAGNPTSCHVHWPSLPARKNEQICDGIMENGSFTPALDGEGQPMASYWSVDYLFGLTEPFGG